MLDLPVPLPYLGGARVNAHHPLTLVYKRQEQVAFSTYLVEYRV